MLGISPPRPSWKTQRVSEAAAKSATTECDELQTQNLPKTTRGRA